MTCCTQKILQHAEAQYPTILRPHWPGMTMLLPGCKGLLLPGVTAIALLAHKGLQFTMCGCAVDLH